MEMLQGFGGGGLEMISEMQQKAKNVRSITRETKRLFLFVKKNNKKIKNKKLWEMSDLVDVMK